MSVAYDYDTAASSTGLGRSTIEKAVYAGDLTVHYLGRKPLILADDLREWIASLPTEKP